MKIYTLLLFICFYIMPSYGMLYKTSKDYPKISLVPFPASITLEEWKKNKTSYERIPLLRDTAEESEYIKTAHQYATGQGGIAYKKDENRLRPNETIFVQTDYPKALKILAKLYTQEAKNEKIILSGNEIISLLRSNLIDYLGMPQPLTNLSELLYKKIEMNPAKYIGFSMTGIEFDDDTIRSLMKKILKERYSYNFINEYSQFLRNERYPIKNQHYELFAQEGIYREDLLFYDGNIKIYGTILSKSKDFYDQLVIVDEDNNRKVIQFDAKVGDITIIPHENKRFYLLKENNEQKDYFLIDVQSLEATLLHNIKACCFVEKDILYTIDNNYSLILNYLGTQDKKVIGHLPERLKSEHIIDLLHIGSKDDNPTLLCITKEDIHLLIIKEEEIIVEKIQRKHNNISCVLLNQSKSKILVQKYWDSKDPNRYSFGSWVRPEYNYHFELYNIVNGVPVFDSEASAFSEKYEEKVSSFLIQNDFIFVYTQPATLEKVSLSFVIPYFDRRGGMHFTVINSGGRVIPTLDHKNLIIDTTRADAFYFPVYDKALLELLDYLNPDKEFKNFSYTQRLEGILFLCWMYSLKTADSEQKAKKIFDTCFPQSIKMMINSVQEQSGKSTSSYPVPSLSIPSIPQPVITRNYPVPSSLVPSITQPIITPHYPVPRSLIPSINVPATKPNIEPIPKIGTSDIGGNWFSSLYNSLQEKIAKHKQALLFGTVYTLGTAALFAALYKYLENRPVPVYHLK